MGQQSTPKKIILLEDEEALGRIYKKKLEAASYEVHWLRTPDETGKLAKRIKADVVLLDHGIKGNKITGIDILPTIRETLPKAKIIVLSNFSKHQLEAAALDAGADAYFVKINMTPVALVAYVKKLFR